MRGHRACYRCWNRPPQDTRTGHRWCWNRLPQMLGPGAATRCRIPAKLLRGGRHVARDAATNYGEAATGTRQSGNECSNCYGPCHFLLESEKVGVATCAVELQPLASNTTTDALFCWNQRNQGLRPARGGAATSTAKCYDQQPIKLQLAYEKVSTENGDVGGLETAKSYY